MFNNPRNITCGISVEIPVEIQMMMWLMVDALKESGKKIDYLQVFSLCAQGEKQKIIHSQEKPKYKSETIIEAANPVSAKVFVIDDGIYSTMLLADEY